VKKTRQNKKLEPGSDSIRTEKALGGGPILISRDSSEAAIHRRRKRRRFNAALCPPAFCNFGRRKRDCYERLIRRPDYCNPSKPTSSECSNPRVVFWRITVTLYFFHILDGQKIFPDDFGKTFSTSDEAIEQARCLAAELRKAGEFSRSNRVIVTDESGQRIFECRP
jgi:hypothetical protein